MTFGAAGCGTSPPPRNFHQKLVILGYDGMDPVLTERWMAEGRLPNLAALAAQGGYARLATSPAPVSPVSWSSFATGANAGKHRIFDSLARDPKTYAPAPGIVRETPPAFLFHYLPTREREFRSTRGGTSFWVTAGRAGVRTTLITVPMTFPAEHVENGELLAGLPLPDLLGTAGTFHYFASDLTGRDAGGPGTGGILKRLAFEANVARTEVTGPMNPIVEARLGRTAASGSALTVPMTVRWNRPERTVTIAVQGATVRLAEGEWSKWTPLEFRANYVVRLAGMAQFYLEGADTELRLYMSPINWRPDAPPAEISYPAAFAKDLDDRLGHYRTLSWAEATSALDDSRLDEKAFMDDLFHAFDDRAQIILNRIDARNWDMLIGVIEAADRVSHMMWRFEDRTHPMYDAEAAARYGDSILRVYQRIDQMVGEVVKRVEPGTQVMVISDHGFRSFRRAVNLNTWLRQEGYLAASGPLRDDVDWPRTRAYATGLGQLFVNLKGREGQGVVEPADYRRVVDELAAKLLALSDPANGARAVSAVYKRDDLYAGEFVQEAPDLQVGTADGFRVSRETALGGSPAGDIFYTNMRKWSGDHGGVDYQAVPGLIISNRRIAGRHPSIVDIAPSALKYFGVAIPKAVDGTPLF